MGEVDDDLAWLDGPAPVPEITEAQIAAAMERAVAIAGRRPAPGLIHHSDHGMQYASTRYVERLRTIDAQISMAAVVKAGLAPYDKRLLAVELNLARRQLTDGQKTLVGKTIEPDLAEQAAQRERIGKRVDPVDNCPQGTTRDEVASRVGLGCGRTYERHKRVLDELAAEPDGALLSAHWHETIAERNESSHHCCLCPCLRYSDWLLSRCLASVSATS